MLYLFGQFKAFHVHFFYDLLLEAHENLINAFKLIQKKEVARNSDDNEKETNNAESVPQ